MKEFPPIHMDNPLFPVYEGETPAADFPWYAVRTRSNQERVIGVALSGKGYPAYVPSYRHRRRWSDRVVDLEMPLFPGYLFCRFDPLKRLPILSTPGVVSIVGAGNTPVALEEHEIDAVRRIEESQLFAEPAPFLSTGQRVRIAQGGALTGLEGLLVAKKNEWRFVVSVSLLQRSVAVEVDRDWVVAA